MSRIFVSIALLSLLAACNNTTPAVPPPSANQPKSEVKEEPNPVDNFLNTPTSIKFGGIDYQLAWSSHPNESYYKQEFLEANDSLERYKQMILIDLVTKEMSAKMAIDQKIQEIEARKATDKYATYELSKSGKEYILDFQLCDGNGDDKSIIEWNVYRCTDYTDSSKNSGVYLLGWSKRGYGTQVAAFAQDIKENKKKYISEFQQLIPPTIQLPNSK